MLLFSILSVVTLSELQLYNQEQIPLDETLSAYNKHSWYMENWDVYYGVWQCI